MAMPDGARMVSESQTGIAIGMTEFRKPRNSLRPLTRRRSLHRQRLRYLQARQKWKWVRSQRDWSWSSSEWRVIAKTKLQEIVAYLRIEAQAEWRYWMAEPQRAILALHLKVLAYPSPYLACSMVAQEFPTHPNYLQRTRS